MKKVSLDMLLGKKTRCFYKKPTAKTTIFKAIIPAGSAVKTPQIGSLLGQYGVDSTKFYKTLNDSTTFWQLGLLIPIIVFISPTKTYSIEYKFPTVYTLLDLCLNFRKRNHFYFRVALNKKNYLLLVIKLQFLETLDKCLKMNFLRICDKLPGRSNHGNYMIL